MTINPLDNSQLISLIDNNILIESEKSTGFIKINDKCYKIEYNKDLSEENINILTENIAFLLTNYLERNSKKIILESDKILIDDNSINYIEDDDLKLSKNIFQFLNRNKSFFEKINPFSKKAKITVELMQHSEEGSKISDFRKKIKDFKNYFHKKLVLNFLGDVYPLYARNEKNKKLVRNKDEILQTEKEIESSISKVEEELIRLNSELTIFSNNPHLVKNLKKQVAILTSELAVLSKRLRDIRSDIIKISKYEFDLLKGNQTRNNFECLGAKRVRLDTSDGAKLDGIFLDATNFRRELAKAGGKMITLKKEGAKPLNGISFLLEEWKSKETHLLNVLDHLNCISQNQFGQPDPGSSGWSLIKYKSPSGQDMVMLVSSKDIPPERESSNWMVFRGAEPEDRLQYRVNTAGAGFKEEFSDIKLHSESGTVILSFGKGGVYEQYKNEALWFLFSGLNVMCFNFRGVGLSEGIPSEENWKLDMEEVYQYVKRETKQPDEKILIKSMCFSGGIGVYVAAKHPQVSLILDQTYSEFQSVAAREIQSMIRKKLGVEAKDSSGPKQDEDILLTKLKLSLVESISSIGASLVSHLLPRFEVSSHISKVQGKKALLYVHDDIAIPFVHVEKNIKTLRKEVSGLRVFSSIGKHGTSWMRMQRRGYEIDKELKEKVEAYKKQKMNELKQFRKKIEMECETIRKKESKKAEQLEFMEQKFAKLEEDYERYVDEIQEIERDIINKAKALKQELYEEASSNYKNVSMELDFLIKQQSEFELSKISQNKVMEKLENKRKALKESYSERKNKIISGRSNSLSELRADYNIYKQEVEEAEKEIYAMAEAEIEQLKSDIQKEILQERKESILKKRDELLTKLSKSFERNIAKVTNREEEIQKKYDNQLDELYKYMQARYEQISDEIDKLNSATPDPTASLNDSIDRLEKQRGLLQKTYETEKSKVKEMRDEEIFHLRKESKQISAKVDKKKIKYREKISQLKDDINDLQLRKIAQEANLEAKHAEIQEGIDDILDDYAGVGSDDLRRYLAGTHYHVRDFMTDFLARAKISDPLI